MAQWLKAGAQIPDDPELATDLTSPMYGYSSKSQVQLERKEDMTSRGLASPDCGDVLAMSFAVKVAPRLEPEPPRQEWHGPTDASQAWMIGIGAAVTRRPLPHHRAYGSVHGGSSWLR
jgi:hypothetical protein